MQGQLEWRAELAREAQQELPALLVQLVQLAETGVQLVAELLARVVAGQLLAPQSSRLSSKFSVDPMCHLVWLRNSEVREEVNEQ